jgi:hypothetical protein
MRISDAAIRANQKAFEGLRHSIFSYIVFGHNMVIDRLDQAAMQCIFHLEQETGGARQGIPAGRPKTRKHKCSS